MDKLITAKIKMGSNSVITCNRVKVLALCINSILSEICSRQAFYCKNQEEK